MRCCHHERGFSRFWERRGCFWYLFKHLTSHKSRVPIHNNTGIKNPIRLARSILEYSKIPDPLGRIPPLFVTPIAYNLFKRVKAETPSRNRSLVSEGARSFAALNAPSVQTVSPEILKSPRAEADWKKWKARIEGPNTAVGEDTLTAMQDTVGAVSWHTGEGMAAGVSRYVAGPFVLEEYN